MGKIIKVIHSPNKHLIGVEGTVIDETRNTFELDNGKKIIKKNSVLIMNNGKQTITLEGKQLVGKPEDRLKKVKHEL